MKRRILTLMMSAALIAGTQSTVWADVEDYSDGDVHTIGVVVYDPDSAEMEMFADYYRDYIQEGFPVKFIFQEKLQILRKKRHLLKKPKQKVQRGSFLLPDMQMGLQTLSKPVKKRKSTMHWVPIR